jgi:hypothetical protein
VDSGQRAERENGWGWEVFLTLELSPYNLSIRDPGYSSRTQGQAGEEGGHQCWLEAGHSPRMGMGWVGRRKQAVHQVLHECVSDVELGESGWPVSEE